MLLSSTSQLSTLLTRVMVTTVKPLLIHPRRNIIVYFIGIINLTVRQSAKLSNNINNLLGHRLLLLIISDQVNQPFTNLLQITSLLLPFPNYLCQPLHLFKVMFIEYVVKQGIGLKLVLETIGH